MYFKIRPLPGVTPFYLDVEKKKRFHIYWNYNASSSRPSLDDLSSEERVVVSILITIWEVEPLDPKNIFSNEEAACKSIAMRRRLLAGNSAIEEGSLSATHSDKENAQGTSEVIKIGPSPPSSPPRKKKKKVKGLLTLQSNFLMTEETEEKASEFAVEDELTRIQKMLLRSVVLSYDVGREIPKFRSTIAAKYKAVHESAVKIKNLNATLATLQEFHEKLNRDAKSASEKREAVEKHVSELKGKLKESEEHRLSLAKSVVDAEKAAVAGVAETETNIKDQCALIAPDIDFSGVSAYKKVVNGEVIEF
ncbi:hypothetical protein PIB30_005621 [Stylosanthes scabra]|uniref:Uncharacterized protein n=1 Tax=Stylosanthes scabra TaxID=79078 RepID=A0ABU6S3U5_9FABA|nr:hypothetical protein [Stylosanthes scabra]